MRRRQLVVVVTAAVGAVVAGLLVATSAPTSADRGVRLLQFNMCGHVCRDASRDKVAGVVDSLARFHPAAVSLNEVCRSQLTAITSGAAERGWAMHAEFIITQPDECSGGVDYGNAVLTHSAVADTDRLTYGAQDPGNPEHRGLLCVATDLDDRPTRICTTHIVDSSDDPVGDVRATQIAMAARAAGSYPGPVVLMGDFNARPAADAMSVLYSKRHAGRARRVRRGRPGVSHLPVRRRHRRIESQVRLHLRTAARLPHHRRRRRARRSSPTTRLYWDGSNGADRHGSQFGGSHLRPGGASSPTGRLLAGLGWVVQDCSRGLRASLPVLGL